jgi:hypothetical protein
LHALFYRQQMISFFTRKIYSSGIQVGCALGDAPPLVGHNAFLRWSAMQQVCPQRTQSQVVKANGGHCSTCRWQVAPRSFASQSLAH